MKKLIVFLCLWLSINNDLIAQTLSIGPKLGHNYFQLIGINRFDKFLLYTDEYAQSGSTVGVFLNYQISKKIALKTELQYSINGDFEFLINTKPERFFIMLSPTNGDSLFWNEQRDFGNRPNFDRLEIPILLEYKVWQPIKWVALKAIVGVLPALRFRDRYDSGFRKSDLKDPFMLNYARIYWANESALNYYHLLNLDYVIGGGLDIGRFSLDARYVKSITNLSGSMTFEDKSYRVIRRAAQLMFSLGYKINLDKKNRKK
ncbi:MAG: PorT family protein [Microscillaceae bacterium]|jgi:hypothetical protein|nr:PorT family protein [Microscillaceae bacterium]